MILKVLLVSFGMASLSYNCVTDLLASVECQKCTAISMICSNDMSGYVMIGGRS